MPTLQDKLSESLAVLKTIQDEGIVASQTKNMTRTHRECLAKSGFIVSHEGLLRKGGENRKIPIYLMKKLTGMCNKQIGGLFGGLSYSAVANAELADDEGNMGENG